MPHSGRVLPETRNRDYAFFRKKLPPGFLDLLAFSASPLGCTIRSGRFPGEPSKNAIELREGLEPYLKGDLADPKLAICQKFPRLVEPGTRNVIDKIYARHLLELFAQMRRIDVDRSRQLGQRNFFGGMLLDELPRLPDVHRFSSTLAVHGLLGWIRRYHLDDNWPRSTGSAHHPLAIAPLILARRGRQLLLA